MPPKEKKQGVKVELVPGSSEKWRLLWDWLLDDRNATKSPDAKKVGTPNDG